MDLTVRRKERVDALPGIVHAAAPTLQDTIKAADLDLHAEPLLLALAAVESSSGIQGGRSRVERAYQPKLYRGDGRGGLHRRHVVDLYGEYGDSAAASWSSFQIMYPTAWELGFRGTPWALGEDARAIHFVILFLERRGLDRGARTVEELADAYNSGDHRDAFQPESYMAKVEMHYHEFRRSPA